MAGPLYDLEIARRINRAHGGAVVTLWEVGEMDDETIYLFANLDQRKAEASAGAAAVESVKAEIRARFDKRH